MLVSRTFTSAAELLSILRGSAVSSGSQGTNLVTDPNLVDASGNGGFADAQVGDTVFISGDTQTFSILTKTDANNIELDANITAAHTGNAIWRIFRNGIDLADIQVGPLYDGTGTGVIIYEKVDFGVPL